MVLKACEGAKLTGACLYGVSLWVRYLGLGVGFLYLVFNPHAATCLFSIVGRKIAGILGWSSCQIRIEKSDYIGDKISVGVARPSHIWAISTM